MASLLKHLALLILLLRVWIPFTGANWIETWLPTDENITYVGSGWSGGWNGFVPSTCFSSTTAARFTGTPGDYATVLFTGLGIYAQSFFNQSSSQVALIFNGEQMTLNPTLTTPNPGCGLLFTQSDLSFTLHNLTIVNTGPRAQMWLYLDRFLITQPGTSSTSTRSTPFTTPTGQPPSTTSPPSSTTSPPLSGGSSLVKWPKAYIVVTTIVIGAMCGIWLISMLTLTPIYAPILRLLRNRRSDRHEWEGNPHTLVVSRLSAFEASKSRLNAFTLVGSLVASVQAQMISLTYQPSQKDTTQIVTNAFSFAGLALDIIGTFFGLIDMANLEVYRRELEQLKSEMEATPPTGHLEYQFNRDVNACFNRAVFIGFIPRTALVFGIIFFMVAFICFIRNTQSRLVFIMTIVPVSCTMGLYAVTFVLRYLSGRNARLVGEPEEVILRPLVTTERSGEEREGTESE